MKMRFDVTLRKGDMGCCSVLCEELKPSDDTVYFSFYDNTISFGITDGNWDRNYNLDPHNTQKFKKALDLCDKTYKQIKNILYDLFDKKGERIQKNKALHSIKTEYLFSDEKGDLDRYGIPDRPVKFYTQIFERLCEKHSIEYAYTTWLSSCIYE